MRILVLGGTRFVGLRVVRRLVAGGYDVTLLNRGKSQVDDLPNVKRLFADRRNPAQLRAALNDHRDDFDAILDFTGYQVINLEPLVDLFAGRIKHYIFQSTAGTYAESDVLPILESHPLQERVAGLAGLAAYSFEKAECEQFLLRAWQERGFPATTFRCSMIYGPENWMDDREGSYFCRLARGLPILIPGKGNTIVQYTYVQDLVRAYLEVLDKPATLGQAYNIANESAITINRYVELLAAAAGVTARKVHLDAGTIAGLERRGYLNIGFGAGEPEDTPAFYSIQKARDHFGFWPADDYARGLKETFAWWTEKRGGQGIEFKPGLLGHNVDLEYERLLAERAG